MLHPYDKFYAGSSRGEFSNQNSDSLVLRIESEGKAVLFTGDIEVEAEENLMHLGWLLKCDIIKAPHHGSRTSSSLGFIEVVGPQVMVASVGKNNPFNHPHPETIDRYSRAGAQIFRTDRDGAVIVTFKDKGFEVMTWRDSRLKEVKSFSDEIKNLKVLL
ncbi:MAG: hypothetical protein HY806_09045 [Nitrospirae bacterium]|nr:hypothetical protein [Nitrospirota bacterium]